MKLKVVLLIFLCFLGAVTLVNIGKSSWCTNVRSQPAIGNFEQSFSTLGDGVPTPGGGGNI